MPLSEADRHAKLKELFDLAQGSEEFEGGVTFQEDMEALVVGDWAFFAIDEIGDLALSFHLDAHPVAVARLTRFLVQHEVPFVLTESFTVDDDDQIVFDSDTGAGLPDKYLAPTAGVLRESGTLVLDALSVFVGEPAGLARGPRRSERGRNRLQARWNALVPRRADPRIAIFTRREFVRPDAGPNALLTLQVIEAETIREREMTGGHRLVDGDSDDGGRALRREPRLSSIADADPRRVAR